MRLKPCPNCGSMRSEYLTGLFGTQRRCQDCGLCGPTRCSPVVEGLQLESATMANLASLRADAAWNALKRSKTKKAYG